MKLCVLGGGSRGNCTYLESGTTRILIDNGFSGKEITRRMAVIGRHPEQLTGIIVTHEHTDHVSGVGVLSRRYNLPVYANSATHLAAGGKVGNLYAIEEFLTGSRFVINDLEIHPFAISHDAAEPVGFVIDDGDWRVGYCTDTGTVTKLMAHLLCRCQGLVLESNHDPQMLKDGPYPFPLKQRVQSNLGHLANGDAASFVSGLGNSYLRTLILSHLSETCNHPRLARTAFESSISGFSENIELLIACQSSPGALIDFG
jgi:phosphoribosyl 1,2-cyclic phosphodiesterase